jgi:outer membrane protein TolC
VGPFSVFDLRANLTQSISFRAINALRASRENFVASQFDVKNARDVVVLFVGGGYIQTLSDQARITDIEAQLATARSLYQQAVDTTEAPYRPNPAITLEQALVQAQQGRADYQSALALEKAAEWSRKAASAQHLPSLHFNSDYGVLGPQPGNSHGTFSASATLLVPIFEGGRIRADEDAAEAVLQQRKAVAQDAQTRVEYEVRSAFLDLNSAAQQVEVARSSVALATQQLQQARDRFAAGVTNNIEVIQAQESLALNQDSYISSLLAHNLAKLALARSLGAAEAAVKQYLGGSQ